MEYYGFSTKSGGNINIGIIKDKFKGEQIMLHLDQSNNINNGEGECSVVIDIDEVKGTIEILNSMIAHLEGKPYVAIIDHTNSQSI